MRPRADMLMRYRSRLLRDVRQVFTGAYVQPVGSQRGRVEIGRCLQDVDASRSSNHAKGESVLVVRTPGGDSGILPAPPSRPGPASLATKKLRGEPFSAPAGRLAKFLVLEEGASQRYEAFTATGDSLGFVGKTIDSVGVGTAISPEPSDGLAQGTRISFDDETTPAGSLDLVTVDYIGADLEGGATHTYTAPSPWTPLSPQKVGVFIFWIEWEQQSNNTSTRARLMRSDNALWTPSGITQIGPEFTIDQITFINPEWLIARGPDFTEVNAGYWQQANVEDAELWHRVTFNLTTGLGAQKTTTTADIESVQWAGHPASGALCITRANPTMNALEDAEVPLFAWDGNVESDPVEWLDGLLNPVGTAVDVAADPLGVGQWSIANDGTATHLSDTGTVIEIVSLAVGDAPVGLAVIDPPILIPDEEEEEE